MCVAVVEPVVKVVELKVDTLLVLLAELVLDLVGVSFAVVVISTVADEVAGEISEVVGLAEEGELVVTPVEKGRGVVARVLELEVPSPELLVPALLDGWLLVEADASDAVVAVDASDAELVSAAGVVVGVDVMFCMPGIQRSWL